MNSEKPVFQHDDLVKDLKENFGFGDKVPFSEFIGKHFPGTDISEWQKDMVDWIQTIPEAAWAKMNPELNGGDDTACAHANTITIQRYYPLYRQLRVLEFNNQSIHHIFTVCFGTDVSPIMLGRMLKGKEPVRAPRPSLEDAVKSMKEYINDGYPNSIEFEPNRLERRKEAKEYKGYMVKETIEERFRKARHARLQNKKDAKK